MYSNAVPKCDRENGKIDADRYPASLGITLEFCAGIVDKNISWDKIAQEEVLEECGYSVDSKDLELIMQYRYLLQ